MKSSYTSDGNGQEYENTWLMDCTFLDTLLAERNCLLYIYGRHLPKYR